MPLFVCDRCHAIDNTACGGNYWDRLLDHSGKEQPALCCECHTGQWHGQFTKRIYQPGDENRPGGIMYIPAALRSKPKCEKRSRKNS